MQKENRPPSKSRSADKAATGNTPDRLGQSTAPKPRRDTGLAWLVLAALLACAAVPLLVELHRPAAWTASEALVTAISAETYQRKTPINEAQTSLEAWTPVYQGITRWDLPPGRVWLNQLMAIGMDPDAATDELVESQTLLLRARLGSVLMTLLFVAAVYWAGHSIGGVTTGVMSAMVAMTMPLVIGFGRHATGDAAALALSSLSIASALWAMRPLRAAPSLPRQFIGWLVCGITLGLATLTAGPQAVPSTLLCTVVLAMLCPRRIGHVLGLIATTVIATLVITPWALHVHDHDPDIWQHWIAELTPDLAELGLLGALQRAGWRISLAMTLTGLWLIWLLPALSQPFSTSTGKVRRKMLLGWAWLVTASVLIALAPGKTQLATLLIAAAPASVAIGQVLQQFHDLSAEGRHARLWLVCRWISVGFMLVLALALPTLGYMLNQRPDLFDAVPHLDQPVIADMHWTYYAGGAIALLLATALAVRFSIGHHPGRAAASLALWLMIASTLAIIPLAQGPKLSQPATPTVSVRPDASP